MAQIAKVSTGMSPTAITTKAIVSHSYRQGQIQALEYLIADAEEGGFWKIDVDVLRDHLVRLLRGEPLEDSDGCV